MTKPEARIIILRGDDETAIHTQITGIIHSLGSSEMAEMNISRLDGKTCSHDELANTVMAVPFFVPRRLVILTNPLAKLESKRGAAEEDGGGKKGDAREKFLALLSEIPESTLLVLVIEDHQKWKAGGLRWEGLGERHFLMKWLASHQEIAKVIEVSLPQEREMPGWITNKAQGMGGKIAPPAAIELAQAVGRDTLLAEKELEKLILYSSGREITIDDVMKLSTSVVSAKIWDLTDAIGSKDARKASLIFHQLLETLDVRTEIFPMIVTHIRTMLQAKEILTKGGSAADLIRDLRILEFQARKIIGQVNLFSLERLLQAYRRLMEIDEQSKGQGEKSVYADPAVLIDQFIFEFSG